MNIPQFPSGSVFGRAILLPDGTVAVSAEGRYVKLPLDEISGIDPEELGWRVYPDEGE